MNTDTLQKKRASHKANPNLDKVRVRGKGRTRNPKEAQLIQERVTVPAKDRVLAAVDAYENFMVSDSEDWESLRLSLLSELLPTVDEFRHCVSCGLTSVVSTSAKCCVNPRPMTARQVWISREQSVSQLNWLRDSRAETA